MQNDEVYEYFDFIWKINSMIDNKIQEKEALYTIATKTTGSSDGMPHASGTSDKVGNIVTEIAALDEEINDLVDDLVEYKKEASRFVHMLENDKCNVVHMIHIQDLSIYDAAVKLGRRKGKEALSYQWVSELRKRGMKDLENIIDHSDLYEKYKKIFKKDVLLDNN